MGDSQKTFELGRMDIVDIYEWQKSQKITTGPTFQRLSVWREKDREELIDTIMGGYPIPAIFICEGQTDFTQIGKKYIVLDGKQRLESISMFLENKIKYKGQTFGEFSDEDKAKFLNFSLPVVQMYIDVTKELPKVQEVFKRLNKNSYNLNEIEKSLSQYVDYDFINICKILCSFIEVDLSGDNEYDLEDTESDETSSETEIIIKNDYSELSFIPPYIIEFFIANDFDSLMSIFKDNRFFTAHEQSRQKSIQHLINILGVLIKKEHINRNVHGKEYETFSEETFVKNELFPIIAKLNDASEQFLELFDELEQDIDSSFKKFWFSKSNLYTFLILTYKFDEKLKAVNDLKEILIDFAENKEISEEFKDYRFACKEAVNNKKVRVKREQILIELLNLND